jgi:hypothetical protein
MARTGTLLFQFAFREGVLSHLASRSVNNLREEPEKDSAVLVNKTDMRNVQEILFSLHNISAAS